MISGELADKLEALIESMDSDVVGLYEILFQHMKAIQTCGSENFKNAEDDCLTIAAAAILMAIQFRFIIENGE